MLANTVTGSVTETDPFLWCSYAALIIFVPTLPRSARHNFALFFFPKRGNTKSHIRSCCALLYSSGEMDRN